MPKRQAEAYISDGALHLGIPERLKRDEKLDVCVKRIYHSEGVPPFCDHAKEVMVRTLDLESSSIELARLILKDVGLTSQVLRVANSALYNRSERPIMSAAHAITLLGWDTVRNMVSAVQYIEHFAKRSPGLRELMLVSVLTAVHGRDVAAAIGYPHPEEAYICGLFRNLGEVLIGCHFPYEYSLIITTMQEEKIPARAACLRVLDFSWDDVGSRVAACWNMPSKIRQCLDDSPTPGASALDRCLASITEYGHSLTHALYRKGAALDTVHLQTVSDPQGRTALISVRDLYRIVDSAVLETQETFAALRIPTDTLRLERQAERAREILESIPRFDEAGLKELDQATQSAGQTVRQRDFELTPLISGLLEALQAAGFDRAVFGLVNGDHTFIRGRLASGASVEEVLKRFQFPIDRTEGSMFAAILRRNDLFVDRRRDARYDDSALVKALDPGAFALFPIVVDRKPAGCLYADLLRAGPGFDAVRTPLGRVRDVIATAIRKRAQGSG